MKLATTKDGSTFLTGTTFFTGDEEASDNVYLIGSPANDGSNGFLQTNTHSTIDDASVKVDAIT